MKAYTRPVAAFTTIRKITRASWNPREQIHSKVRAFVWNPQKIVPLPPPKPEKSELFPDHREGES